jgi:integrase
MAGKKLPIFERFSEDGRLMGYQVRIRKAGFAAISQQFDRKADAQRFAIDTLAQMERGTFIDRKEIEAITLADAVDRYDAEIGPTKKRPEGCAHYARHWKKQALAKRIISTITATDFAKYRDTRLKEGLAGNSVRLELAFVRHLYTIAIKEWGWPVTNPVASIRMPKVAPGRQRRLEQVPDETGKTEEQRLFAALDESLSPYIRDLVVIALETGMRQGEILGMRWENVDFEKCTAFLPDTKNGTTRNVPLSSVAIAALKGRLPEEGDKIKSIRPPTGQIFPIGPASATHSFQRACARAGITNLHFHDLRHEAASRLFEKGLGMMEVASVTGHKTLQMLKRYTHLRAEDLAKKLG